MKSKTITALLVFALLANFARSNPPEEGYYLLVFAAQPPGLKVPQKCHTWATIVKSVRRDQECQVEAHTISWVPADLKVRLLTCRSKPGMNWDLNSTINYYQGKGTRVSVWGPYALQPEAGPEIYRRTMAQIARLENGQMRYMAIDPDFGPRVDYVSDCIHAITDIDMQEGRTFYSELLRFGDDASSFIVKVLTERGRIHPERQEEWVFQALGLADRCLIRRTVGK